MKNRPPSFQKLLVDNGIIPVADGVRMGDSNRFNLNGEEAHAETVFARRLREEQEAALRRMLGNDQASPARRGRNAPAQDGRHPSQIFCDQNPAACAVIISPPHIPPSHGTPGQAGPGGNAQNANGGIVIRR